MKKGFLAAALLIIMVFTSVPVLAKENADASKESSVSQQLAEKLNDETLKGFKVAADELENKLNVNDSAQKITSIRTKQDLINFTKSINEGKVSYEGTTVWLEADIVLDGAWAPVEYFNGTFDGQEYTISGMTIKNDPDAVEPQVFNGFFAFLGKDAKVEKLNIAGEINAFGNVGGIAAVNLGKISECTFSGTLTSRDKDTSGAGGIAGINMGDIDGCITSGTYTRAGTFSGGIAGINAGNCTTAEDVKKISNCTNKAAVICATEAAQSSGGATGGIVGINRPVIDRETVRDIPAQIEKCVNNGPVTSNSAVTGGIVGLSENSKIESCENRGNITQGYYLWTGGIVGSYNQSINFVQDSSEIIYIRKCTNTGNVNGVTRVGGIAGGDEGHNTIMVIEDCINSGDLRAEGANGGGYIGGIDGYSASSISRCYNMGSITNVNPEWGYNAAGGIASRSGKPVTDCFNLGNIYTQVDQLADTYATGGIVGIADYNPPITRCYNTGAVTGNHENRPLEDGKYTVYYGGIVGNGSNASLSGCYFNRDTSGKAKRAVASEIGEGSDYGLRTWQMTGQRAITFMPELFAQRAADGFYAPENQTISGVEYSMTPQLGTLKASYVLAPEKGLQNAAFVFATVTLPQGEGYTASAAEGFHSEYVALGSDFSFTVALAEGHQNDTVTVMANGAELKPDENGLYTIRDVRENQTVSVTLTAPQQKETPAGEGGSDSGAKGGDKMANPKTGEIVKDAALPCMAVALLALGMTAIIRKRRAQ